MPPPRSHGHRRQFGSSQPLPVLRCLAEPEAGHRCPPARFARRAHQPAGPRHHRPYLLYAREPLPPQRPAAMARTQTPCRHPLLRGDPATHPHRVLQEGRPLARNLRTIQVLIDRESILTGATHQAANSPGSTTAWASALTQLRLLRQVSASAGLRTLPVLRPKQSTRGRVVDDHAHGTPSGPVPHALTQLRKPPRTSCCRLHHPASFHQALQLRPESFDLRGDQFEFQQLSQVPGSQPALRRPGGKHIHRIRLTPPSTNRAIRPVDLDHFDPVSQQVAGEGSSVAAGPFHPGPVHRTQLPGPLPEFAIAPSWQERARCP